MQAAFNFFIENSGLK